MFFMEVLMSHDCGSGCGSCGCDCGSICQSCAMPLQDINDFGTKKDGKKSKDYCRFCYESGKFTDGCKTAQQKAELIAAIVAKMRGVAPKNVKVMAKKFVPQLKTLKRWKKKGAKK